MTVAPGWVPFLASCLLWAGTGAPPATDPLGDLNGAFREAYAAAKRGAQDRQGPVLVVSGDQLLCFRDRAQVAEAVIRPEPYHRLKAMAHVPLCVRLLAKPSVDRPLAPGEREALAKLRTGIAAAQGGLDAAFPAPARFRRQQVILEGSLRLLDEALARGTVASKVLDAYSAAMRPLLQANIKEAADLQLEALRTVVAGWRKTLLATSWDQVKVVVIGSHMARSGEVSWQFFTRLLGAHQEGGRLVFAEEKWDVQDALGLLAAYQVDHDLGDAFFRDPRRLQRDVLGDAAKKWLDSHPPER